MAGETGWDYSEIPERKWTWHFEEDHWMDLIVNSSGLTYYGTDWTCQSGGRYFGGFQTFEEFLSKKSLNEMPKKIAKEVSHYIRDHRKKGGSTLQLVYIHEMEGFHLSGVFVHLDDNPIQVKEVRATGKMPIFEGSITPGMHTFSFAFVLRAKDEQKKISGEVQITIRDGANQSILETTVDDDGNLITKLADD